MHKIWAILAAIDGHPKNPVADIRRAIDQGPGPMIKENII
jgi:hypothetical protein